MINSIIRFCLENKLVITLLLMFIIIWGILVAPFDWKMPLFPRDPVPVDAIPDIGENQQIVFTKWMGRSPQDIEDQITYPLTTALLGLPGVKTIRSYSFFGFSSIYIIFKEDIEFYWSRSRVLEKLSSLPSDTLPDGVQPSLGPDATALGQVFWYTLEGVDEKGKETGGWDLHELRSAQDWYVRYALQSVDGVAEVASIGGYVQEYQIDVDPDAMRAFGVNMEQIYQAIRMSNLDIGARTIEINKTEYIIRALGFITNLKDLENTVVKANQENIPVYVKNVAHVSLGPALRRGALDKGGAEAVGGVVVVRYGSNPLEVIQRVKEKIELISKGLPKKILSDGTHSQISIVPFYDRTGLIYETLGTLNSALVEEILITIIVILMMVMHLRSSLLISLLLPVAVLLCFIAMKTFGVDANIVALSGIAIAVGTIVDMGIVVCENILKHLNLSEPDENRLEIIYRATIEVGSAVLTAVLTTVISFLPVFAMEAAEGKLFKPLAFTKTFALLSSIIVTLTILPPFAHVLFAKTKSSKNKIKFWGVLIGLISLYLLWHRFFKLGFLMIGLLIYLIYKMRLPVFIQKKIPIIFNLCVALWIATLLAHHWMPLGPEYGVFNSLFVIGLIGSMLVFFQIFQWVYPNILKWCLNHKALFLSMPVVLLMLGLFSWLGFGYALNFAPSVIKKTSIWSKLEQIFPGLGKEFMPSLDEGSYLFMPTTMPHASIGEVMDIIKKQDMAIMSIPEVEQAVGKLGRVDSPLDPAPISMIETIISYIPEYLTDKNGQRINFKYNRKTGQFIRDENNELIQDPHGIPFRQWRKHIQKPEDIWKEIVKIAQIPGTTSAPKLQPIAARIVMLQSGMRAPMGVKIYGDDLKKIEMVGLQIEQYLKEVPLVEKNTVIADRIVGKPYLEIKIDREAIARYGINILNIQNIIEVAIGGKAITQTVEGRARYPVRVRYMRELRDSIESLERILIPAMNGVQIPLVELADIQYKPGPQVIKSEDTFLVGYVVFDMIPGAAEVDVVEACQKYLNQKIDSGELVLPSGYSYKFSGSYENQIRSERKMRVVLPLALFAIFLILYLQFKSVSTTLIVFSGVFVAWSGGFLMIWFYSQDWFLNFHLFGIDLRELFQVRGYNLSVAIWVGFLALFGIATDDGVIIATYLKQNFSNKKFSSIQDIHNATIESGQRRIRPALMTVATTILALIPILTSSGHGSDVMIPMAIPSFGGMTVVLITVFVVPTLYCWVEEIKFKNHGSMDS